MWTISLENSMKDGRTSWRLWKMKDIPKVIVVFESNFHVEIPNVSHSITQIDKMVIDSFFSPFWQRIFCQVSKKKERKKKIRYTIIKKLIARVATVLHLYFQICCKDFFNISRLKYYNFHLFLKYFQVCWNNSKSSVSYKAFMLMIQCLKINSARIIFVLKNNFVKKDMLIYNYISKIHYLLHFIRYIK